MAYCAYAKNTRTDTRRRRMLYRNVSCHRDPCRFTAPELGICLVYFRCFRICFCGSGIADQDSSAHLDALGVECVGPSSYGGRAFFSIRGGGGPWGGKGAFFLLGCYG